MNYIVKINYTEFTFDDADYAINFATTAKRHLTEQLKEVSITVKTDDEIRAEQEAKKPEIVTEITEEVF